MRLITAAFGVSLITVGTAAACNLNVGDTTLWILSAFIAIIGVVGLGTSRHDLAELAAAPEDHQGDR